MCNDLTGPFPVFQSEERLMFCTEIEVTVAGIVAEIALAHGVKLEPTKIRSPSEGPPASRDPPASPPRGRGYRRGAPCAPPVHGRSLAGLHEDERALSARTKDLHRAIVSLQEELEAIDWYQQRADATEDPELREILEHNRDEEKEHAMMLLEWIRRKDVVFWPDDEAAHRPRGPIVSEAEEAEAAGEADVEGGAGKGSSR